MVSKVRINFSFQKLSKNLDSIIDKGIKEAQKSSAEAAKSRILKGLQPPLKKSTIELRKQQGIAGTNPLIATGNLLKSIKDTDKGIEMAKYGIYHEFGYWPKKIPTGINKRGKGWFVLNRYGISVPARPFIFPSASDINSPLRKVIRFINKSFRTPFRVFK